MNRWVWATGCALSILGTAVAHGAPASSAAASKKKPKAAASAAAAASVPEIDTSMWIAQPPEPQEPTPPRVVEPSGPLEAHLEPLRPLLNTNWKAGNLATPLDKPLIDVMRFERILNGRAVHMFHSTNEGLYAGDAVYHWDDKAKVIRYHYVTNMGFSTDGTLKIDGKVFNSHEKLDHPTPEGTTEVRTRAELVDADTFHVVTEYRKKGKWSQGRDVTYRPDTYPPRFR